MKNINITKKAQEDLKNTFLEACKMFESSAKDLARGLCSKSVYDFTTESVADSQRSAEKGKFFGKLIPKYMGAISSKMGFLYEAVNDDGYDSKLENFLLEEKLTCGSNLTCWTGNCYSRVKDRSDFFSLMRFDIDENDKIIEAGLWLVPTKSVDQGGSASRAKGNSGFANIRIKSKNSSTIISIIGDIEQKPTWTHFSSLRDKDLQDFLAKGDFEVEDKLRQCG